MVREIALLARMVSPWMKMTKRYAMHYRLLDQTELNVQTDRLVLAKNVLLVRHHARHALIHQTTVSYVPPDNFCSTAAVSLQALMEYVQELVG